ncbi:MAG TPA: DUF2959 family protein [Humisphaera sp.]
MFTRHAPAVLALAAASFAAAGCSTGGRSADGGGGPTMAGRDAAAGAPAVQIASVSRTQTALAGVRSLRDELATDKQQVDATTAALQEVVQGQGDLAPSFGKFVAATDQLKATQQRVTTRVEEMRSTAQTYMVGWEAEVLGVDDADLRRRADQRRNEVRADYTRLNETLKATRESYAALEQQLSDLKKFLGNDLTKQGVAAAAPGVTKANQAANDLKGKLDVAIAELDRVSGLMTPAGPATQPAVSAAR